MLLETLGEPTEFGPNCRMGRINRTESQCLDGRGDCLVDHWGGIHFAQRGRRRTQDVSYGSPWHCVCPWMRTTVRDVSLPMPFSVTQRRITVGETMQGTQLRNVLIRISF